MNQNFRLYGYPFINMNWKPHFTIGSISFKKNQYEFIKKFKKKIAYKKQFLNKQKPEQVQCRKEGKEVADLRNIF